MLDVCCRWRPSGSLCSISYHHLGAIYERSEEEGGCDGLPSLETQPNCVDVTLKLGSAAEVACHFAVSGDRLPNHTEGHRLNGRDELSTHLSTAVAWRKKKCKHFVFYKYFCLVLGLLKSRISKKSNEGLERKPDFKLFHYKARVQPVSKITTIATRNRC